MLSSVDTKVPGLAQQSTNIPSLIRQQRTMVLPPSPPSKVILCTVPECVWPYATIIANICTHVKMVHIPHPERVNMKKLLTFARVAHGLPPHADELTIVA